MAHSSDSQVSHWVDFLIILKLRVFLYRQAKLLMIRIDGQTLKTETLLSSSTVLRRTKYYLAGFTPRSLDASGTQNFSTKFYLLIMSKLLKLLKLLKFRFNIDSTYQISVFLGEKLSILCIGKVC